MKWREPTTAADRWATKLRELRDGQADHPGMAAELWEGDSSTAYVYRGRLQRGLVPSGRLEVPLAIDVTGFVFTTRQVGLTRRMVLGMWVGTQDALPFPEPEHEDCSA